MCLRPLVIKNRSHYIAPNGGKPFVQVPCGKCKECRAEKAREWELRIYSEYEQNRLQNWRTNYIKLWKDTFTYFETFTYSNVDVPRWHGFMCFSPEHIKKFRDHLRKRIIRYKDKNGICKFATFYEDGFKMIIVSEYGGITHRPHYHALFFINIPGMSVWLLRRFIRDCWPYGFLDREETIFDRLVDGVGVMKYISNYVKKDDDYVYELEKFLDEWKKRTKKDIPKGEKFALLPFHRQSKGFGKSLLKQFSTNELFEKGVIRYKDGPLADQEFQIPLYIQRQNLFYKSVPYRGNLVDVNGKLRTRYAMTQLGRDFKMRHLDEQIKLKADELEKIHNDMRFFHGDDDNQRYVQLYNDLMSYMLEHNITYKDLALYNDVYRGVTDDPGYIDVYGVVSPDMSLVNSKEYYYYRLAAVESAPYVNNEFDEVRGSTKGIYHHRLFSSLFYVSEYDRLLEDLYDFKYLRGIGIQQRYNEDLAYRSKMKFFTHSWLLPRVQHNINNFKILDKCTQEKIS